MRDADGALRTDHLLADIGHRSARGGVITFGAQAAKVSLQFVTVAVLARLLPPSAFGLIAMVTAVNTVFDFVKEMGLSAATIRKSEITHDEVSALFWINTAAGAVIAITLAALAPVFAALYGEPALIGMTRSLAVGFLLSGLSVQHWALLRRQMRFASVAIVDVGSEAAGFVVALSLAVAHAGYWALVGQRLTVPAVALLVSWTLCRWRPSLPRRVAGLGSLVGFGASVTWVNIASAVTRSLDQITVGFLWGPATLGLYERAAKLLLAPTVNLVVPLYAITMPVMSRLEFDRDRYRRAFCEIVGVVAMIVIPGAAIVATTPDWIVAIIFGRGWQNAAPLVTCFAVAAAFQPMVQIAGVLYLTQDRGREMLRAASLDCTLAVVAILAGARFGAFGVAASLAAVGWGLRLPAALWLASRRGPVQMSDLTEAIVPPAIAALAAAAAIMALRRFVLIGPFPPGIDLPLAVAVGIASAAATLSITPHGRHMLIALMGLPRRFRRGHTPLPT